MAKMLMRCRNNVYSTVAGYITDNFEQSTIKKYSFFSENQAMHILGGFQNTAKEHYKSFGYRSLGKIQNGCLLYPFFSSLIRSGENCTCNRVMSELHRAFPKHCYETSLKQIFLGFCATQSAYNELGKAFNIYKRK